jgi:hypothetical protein
MPTTKTDCRRSQHRFTLVDESAASVEFVFPAPTGRHYSLPLVNISVSGISFLLQPDRAPGGLEIGEDLTDATITVAGCSMSGELVVMHITEEAGRAICGALFYPAGDADLVKLKSVVAGMEAARQGG